MVEIDDGWPEASELPPVKEQVRRLRDSATARDLEADAAIREGRHSKGWQLRQHAAQFRAAAVALLVNEAAGG